MQNFNKKEMGPLTLMLVSVSAIFGSGWLFTPFYAAQTAGPQAIIAWLIGAFISIVIGITMAEVITLFPTSGGLNTIIGISRSLTFYRFPKRLCLLLGFVYCYWPMLMDFLYGT
jgi:amino acid transporter